MKPTQLLAAFLLASGIAAFAQSNGAVGVPQLSPADRVLARDVFAELININTSHSVGSTTVAAEAIAKRLRDAGFADADVRVLGPDSVNGKRKNLLVHWPAADKSTQKPALFICHLDVVEAPRDQWQTDPFVFTEKDGYFYGRGTQDIKNADAALVTDLIMLRRSGFEPTRDLYFAFTADEEGGPDNGMDWLLKHCPGLKDAAFVINPDAGILVAHNGKPETMQVAATEKTYADFELRVNGPGGHGSLPTPENPIYSLAAALTRLHTWVFPVELNAVTREYFTRMATTAPAETAAAMRGVLQSPPDAAAAEQLSRDPLMNATLRTTCVATMLKAGEALNALPATAAADVNCRILPGHSPEEVRGDLERIVADNKVKVSYVTNGEGRTATAPDSKGNPPPPPLPAVFAPLETITHGLFPGVPIVPEMETGASDSIYTTADGIPSYGISGFAIDGDDIRFHARDERLRVESYYAGVEFYRLYIEGLGQEH